MSTIRQIENEKKTNLLTNIINKWIDENNNITNKNQNIKYQNISDWPKRSPFEFYNKNIIIPNDNKKYKNFVIIKNQKLKVINDDVNQIITKNRLEQNNEADDIKVSLLSKNKKTPTGSIIIKPIMNEENSKEVKNISNNIQRKNYEEKDIIYNFGYSKEERIEPLKLSLIRNQTDDEIEKNYEFKNNNENNNFKLTFEKKEELEDKLNEEKKEIIVENLTNKKIQKMPKVPKILIIPKSQKEIDYYKEKDLFDEEINSKDKYKDFSVTKAQMNFLENVTNNNYNKHSSLYEQKVFEIKHPLLEYDYYKIKENGNDKNIYTYKTKKKLYNMLRKQRMIIDNIMIRKNNIYNNNINISSPNIINKIFQIKRNNSSTNSTKLSQRQPKYLEKKIFKSFSTNDYYNKNNWEKRQFLLDKKKEYSVIVSLNEKRNIEERQNNLRLIKRIKLNERRKKLESLKSNDNLEKNNNEKETNFGNRYKLPQIRRMKIDDDNDEIVDYKKNVYTNSYNPLKKYRLRKTDEEKIFNTVLKNNPQLGQLLNNHEIYKMRFENIKSHIK